MSSHRHKLQLKLGSYGPREVFPEVETSSLGACERFFPSATNTLPAAQHPPQKPFWGVKDEFKPSSLEIWGWSIRLSTR